MQSFSFVVRPCQMLWKSWSWRAAPQKATVRAALLQAEFCATGRRMTLVQHKEEALQYKCSCLRVSCVQGDGGKVCCGLRYLLQDSLCLAYSLGSAGDTSFEQEIVNRTSCKVENISQAITSLATERAYPFGGGAGRPLLTQTWSLEADVPMQVHTFDPTLSQTVQDAVASTPGISFHPWGVGSPSKKKGVCTAPEPRRH